MPIVDPFGTRVVARLLDFFGSGIPWYRRLWCSSSLLALEEVLEASYASRAGILGEELFGSTVQAALSLAGPDPGIGTKEGKKALQQALQALKKNIAPNGVDFEVVKLGAEAVRANYLHLWAEAINRNEKPGPERTARAIASHLLDAGFSPRHLHRWCKYQAHNATGAASLSELVENAHTMLKKPLKEFSVLVPFEGVPESKSGRPSNWVPAKDVVSWLASQGLDAAGVQQDGALLFRLPARDPWAAVEAAVDTVDQLSSRVVLGTNGHLKPSRSVWVEVDGIQQLFSFGRQRRRVEVHALHREDKLYSLEKASIVDAALHMMGALNSAPASTAITTGWAAIEALLSGPGDHDVVAGTRLADLVACSFVRAELTTLSYRLRAGDPLLPILDGCNTNRERAKVIANAIQKNAALTLSAETDKAAADRMRKILRNPYDSLKDIHNQVAAVFTRMYKNRNLVIHWGKIDAVGLSSNLQAAGPLAGAGVDRIAHAWFVNKVPPMELAARAQFGLETVGSYGGPDPVDILE
jgi:hypothetical protein